MEPSFLDWLAGFLDGEGCFGIAKNKTSYFCRMSVEVRSDDLFILEEIQNTLGLGRITKRPLRKSSPQVVWTVCTKDDCLELVRLLDRHPLRAKKARDYYLWRLAVLAWEQHKPGDSWELMGRYKRQLTELKKFRVV